GHDRASPRRRAGQRPRVPPLRRAPAPARPRRRSRSPRRSTPSQGGVVTLVPVPQPGTDLVPDGWCESAFVPWLEQTTAADELATAAAQLDGLVAAYRTLDADARELLKARRHLEVRWGELLGPARPGPQQSSLASEDLLTPNQRMQFRRLAEHKDAVLAV